VGRKTKFLLTKPEYCLYVDEVGCNTSQKADGDVGGQKFVVGTNQRALIRASHQDCHFAVGRGHVLHHHFNSIGSASKEGLGLTALGDNTNWGCDNQSRGELTWPRKVLSRLTNMPSKRKSCRNI
jgi:hypothetical protein